MCGIDGSFKFRRFLGRNISVKVKFLFLVSLSLCFICINSMKHYF